MEEVQQKNPEEIENDKKGFVKWVKEHKDQLALAGGECCSSYCSDTWTEE